MQKFLIPQQFICIMALVGLLMPGNAVAENNFSEYGSNQIGNIVLPEVEAGWFVHFDAIGETDQMIGAYPAKGRVLAANGTSIYLQKNYGAGAHSGDWQWNGPDQAHTGNLPGGNDNFLVVGTTTETMDPIFIKVSPDGNTVALGVSWTSQLLLVFPISLLDPDNPPVLDTHPSVTAYTINCYEGQWVPEEAGTANYRLALNGGSWPGPFESDVAVLDVTQPNSEDLPYNPVPVIGSIGGASADIDFDNDGNMITGCGYGTDPETGQIKIFTRTDWETVYASGGSTAPLDYAAAGHLLAESILSAAAMGVDKDDNLHVGGGDFVDGSENGFAALVHADVVARVLTGGDPVNEGLASEYRQLQPDYYGDDSATSPIEFNLLGEGLNICWNPTGTGTQGSGSDWWQVGVKPVMTTYYGVDAPDSDGDDIPDTSDNAYMTPNPNQWDADEDSFGNACDCDLDNNGSVGFNDYDLFVAQFGQPGGPDQPADFDESSTVGFNDLDVLITRWGQEEPFK